VDRPQPPGGVTAVGLSPTVPLVAVPSVAAGFAWGLAAAAIWGGYMAFARAGITGGVQPIDFVLLRFLPAALLVLPLLLRRGVRDLGGVGWGKGLLLTAFAGPGFILLGAGGFVFAPLAHGAVLQPTTVTLATMALGAFALNEVVGQRRWLGAAVVIVGVALVSGVGGGESGAWRGDLMFIAAGLCWAAFTLAARVWRVDPLGGTLAVSVLGGIVAVPLWFAFGDPAALWAQGWRVLATQSVMQGVLSGVFSVYAFSRAVAALGASRSALFPAMVPGLGVLAGIPIAGEWPTDVQWLGLAIVLLALPVAMGLLGKRRS